LINWNTVNERSVDSDVTFLGLSVSVIPYCC